MPTKFTGKVGSKSVSKVAGVGMAGGPGKVRASAAIAGPKSPGAPPAMKKALAKKPARGGNVTGFPGSVR